MPSHYKKKPTRKRQGMTTGIGASPSKSSKGKMGSKAERFLGEALPLMTTVGAVRGIKKALSTKKSKASSKSRKMSGVKSGATGPLAVKKK